MSVSDRPSRVAAVVESLEREMELLCVTGVEDRLQDRVRPTLELLRNAGIKVEFVHPYIEEFFHHNCVQNLSFRPRALCFIKSTKCFSITGGTSFGVKNVRTELLKNSK